MAISVPALRHWGRLLWLVGIMLGALMPLVASARPKLFTAVLKYGGSPRVKHNIWGFLEYGVENPDAVATTVTIVLTPLKQRNITIYEHTVTLPAGTRLRFRTSVTVGTVEHYNADLYYQGNLLQSEHIVLKQADAPSRPVIFINDNSDLPYGQFKKNEALEGLYVTTFLRARSAPRHWAAYDSCHLLVLVQPDYRALDSRQINAILDFVARGGTLLFSDPGGILQAWQTPFHKLLPVMPMRLRKVERVTAFKELGGTELFWPEGTDLLEGIPLGEGLTTLTHEEFPLVRWQRYGLGAVGVCTVNPSQHAFTQADNGVNFAVAWNLFLSYGGHLTYQSSHGFSKVMNSLGDLTGVEIPRPGTIRTILLGYFVVILGCIVFGLVRRVQVRSWAILAAIAAVATALTFSYASFRSQAVGQRTAARLSFMATGTEDGSAEDVVSLFSKSQDQADVGNASPDCRLRAPVMPRERNRKSLASGVRPATRPAAIRAPPEPGGNTLNGAAPAPVGDGAPATKTGAGTATAGGTGSAAGTTPAAPGAAPAPGATTPPEPPNVDRGLDEVVRDPLKVSQEDGVDQLRATRLNAYAPKFYAALYSLDTDQVIEPPLVKWTPEGLTMPTWTMPGDTQPLAVALVCRNGYLPLTFANGKLSAERLSGGLKPPSSEILLLEQHLGEVDLPAPFIALFEPFRTEDSGCIPKGFEVVGRTIRMIPIRQDLTGGTVSVPPEQVRVNTIVGHSMLLRMQDRWAQVSETGPRKYRLLADLPRELIGLRITRLRVEFVGDNRGGNLDFGVLLPAPTEDDHNATRGPDKVTGNTYEFTDLPPGLADASTGRFPIMLSVVPRKAVMDPVARLRLNTWEVRKLAISVTGELPPARGGIF